MNIVHLLAPALTGGLERVVQGISIAQRDRGDRVSVLAVVEEPMLDHPFRAPLDRAGVDVREIVVGHRAYRKERRDVAAACVEIGADVVHSHGYHPDVVNGSALRRLGMATVSTVHGYTRGSWRNRLYEYLHIRALRQFDAVIAVSNPIATQLVASGVHADRVRVVENAWSQTAEPPSRAESRRLLGLPEAGRVIGWLGRMSREKGIDVFVDALARLEDTALTACIIGDGPERDREQRRADQMIPGRITWTGMVPEAGRLCRAFDLFVLSSRTEGIPLAMLEAIAVGTPVVATRVGGVPDVVGNEQAILVPSENPAALAAAITESMTHPDRAEQRAVRAKTRLVKSFGPDQWVERHEAVYRHAQSIRRQSAEPQMAARR